ncbi:MAG TPA: hypothetical protein EYQ50_07955 [Verrucomicrobiales bacterium]|nr:hypothetical protein [Verrucomicrobiales bacterium]HIL71732.1 hypothetical protein [Verrucomicrobiota bacterium]
MRFAQARQFNFKPYSIQFLFAFYVLTNPISPPRSLADKIPVDGQPLGANIRRVIRTMEFIGFPYSPEKGRSLEQAIQSRDSDTLQALMDDEVLFVITINPESRVKVRRGNSAAVLQQNGYTPVLIKIVNQAEVTSRLNMTSPQSGPVYAGPSEFILRRQAQTELIQNENLKQITDRFLDLDIYRETPMTPNLSGLEVEYLIGLIYSSESGKREATLQFDVGQGTQDLGFRSEVPILFKVHPAIPVQFRILDYDESPTTARLLIKDASGRVYPPQPKRLAPDFFFQQQIYRKDGGIVYLPSGKFMVTYNRGPEYLNLRQTIEVTDESHTLITLKLKRWINPEVYGYFSGDHHIHAAGCSHYNLPTQGVSPEDMFLQVKGEGLNVGCVLTWGPCFDFQRQFFAPQIHGLSQAKTLLKYDLEISGFGSQSLGHVCLLNLRNQTYPGSKGSKHQGWPSWTVPVMQWTKDQGGFTGYAHSASGMKVEPETESTRLINLWDADTNKVLSKKETKSRLLPEPFESIDQNKDGTLSRRELEESLDRIADELPNYAIPGMNGVGAMEIFVSAPLGACDFISAMDTARIQEWNTFYHLLNCGLPIKISGETDFPCMSSTRVGQGRVYVKLGPQKTLSYSDWCQGLAEGRSYVSDGYAHALNFKVNGQAPGNTPLNLNQSGKVHIAAEIAFAPEIPIAVAYGTLPDQEIRRLTGDTVDLHAEKRFDFESEQIKTVELIVNGFPVRAASITADGLLHKIEFNVEIKQSSWIALRHFPQFHTNPVTVTIDEMPIRVSRKSAQWCIESINKLWKNRHHSIADDERKQAATAYQKAREYYQSVIEESAPGT